MAVAKVRSGGFSIDVEVQDLDQTERSLRQVRAQIARRTDEEAKLAAQATILPLAKLRAGNLKIDGVSIGSSIIVRRIRGGARLTTTFRGVRAQAAGLLEFGGKVRAPILPKKKQALFIPGSAHPISRVRTMRDYRARRYLSKARDEGLSAFGDELRDRLVEMFRIEGFEVD